MRPAERVTGMCVKPAPLLSQTLQIICLFLSQPFLSLSSAARKSAFLRSHLLLHSSVGRTETYILHEGMNHVSSFQISAVSSLSGGTQTSPERSQGAPKGDRHNLTSRVLVVEFLDFPLGQKKKKKTPVLPTREFPVEIPSKRISPGQRIF